jgi:hypothetical protein
MAGFEDSHSQAISPDGSPFHGFPEQASQQAQQRQMLQPPAYQPPPFFQHQGQQRQHQGDDSANQRQAYDQGWDGYPDPGRSQQFAAPNQQAASVAALRTWFPLLHAMPDDMMAATDLATLMVLNKSLQPAAQQGPLDPMSQAAELWAAAAAKITGSVQRQEDEPGIAMAKNLEALRLNPLQIPAGRDDRSGILHPARFLGGAVCSAKKMWREAREVIGLDGIPPLSSYDLSAIGLGGCVTMRGFKEMHNPASPHNTLKLYSSSNMGSQTGASRRLTLADGDRSVNIGDNMKEVSDLNEMRLAVRAMCRTAQLVMPWNMSYNAIDGFLHNSNYGYAELNGRSNRAALLTDFVNYVLGLNAAAWVQKEDFLTSGEIKTIWGEWFGSRPASLLAVTSASSTGGGQGVAGSSNSNGNGGAGRGRGGPRMNHSTPGQFTFPPPAIHGGGGSGTQTLCRRYNHGYCPNTAATCVLANGTRLHHRYDAMVNNVLCNKGHPRIHHH